MKALKRSSFNCCSAVFKRNPVYLPEFIADRIEHLTFLYRKNVSSLLQRVQKISSQAFFMIPEWSDWEKTAKYVCPFLCTFVCLFTCSQNFTLASNF